MRNMSDHVPPNSFLTPLPAQIRPVAGLLDEDSEKRVLREKLETIEAKDLDQLAEDLKTFSSLFNQKLQTIVADTHVEASGGKLPFMNPSDPFMRKVRHPSISFSSPHIPSCRASRCDGQQVHFHRGLFDLVANSW